MSKCGLILSTYSALLEARGSLKYLTVVWITVSLLHYMIVSKGFPLSSGALDTKSALSHILFCEFA